MTSKATKPGSPFDGELVVVTWPIERLLPYANNPRNNEGAVPAVAQSLREFGWRQPIVVDGNGVVVVGHTRLAAALSLGMTKVPVHVADDLTLAKLRTYRLADNRVHENATWNDDRLAEEFLSLHADNIDLGLTGFTEAEIEGRMGEHVEFNAFGKTSMTDADVATGQFGVIVMCEGETQQRLIYERLTAEGLMCRVVVT